MQSTTKFSRSMSRPIMRGYLTLERSLRLTRLRRCLGPTHNSISTTGLRSLDSAERMVCQRMIGRRSCRPPYFAGNLNSATLSFMVSSRASKEEWAAPVSMRAGSLIPQVKRITSSTKPILTFSPAWARSPPLSKNKFRSKMSELPKKIS